MSTATSEAYTILADQIRQQGWAVADHLVPKSLCDELSADLLRVATAGDFRKAKIGPADHSLLKESIRSDHIYWLDPSDGNPAQAHFFAFISDLMGFFSRHLLLATQTFEAHYADYPPGGSYRKHLDQFLTDDCRQMSCVLYLNEEWGPQDGGELVLYNEHESDQVDCVVEPRYGRFVVFLSASIFHEVRPTTRHRRSVTGWMKQFKPL